MKLFYFTLMAVNAYSVLVTDSVFMGIVCAFFATFWFYMICGMTLRGE